VNIKKGDTVTWAGDVMHTIKEILPNGSKSWLGKLTKKASEESLSQ